MIKSKFGSLIVPASYHDGEHFPPEAKKPNFLDFSDYTSTLPAFWNTTYAVEFEHTQIKTFAKDIAKRIDKAPDYDDKFPIYRASANGKKPKIKRIVSKKGFK